MASHTALRAAIGLGMALVTAGMVGCGEKEEAGEGTTVAAPTTQPFGLGAAGGAPTYGEPTGTGFPSGDAAHSSGSGSGQEGFHGTGAMGTSATVSDLHKVDAPAKNATPPVLPEQ